MRSFVASNVLHDNRGILLSMVRQWDRRWRARQTLVWLPRAALPGLALGVVLAVISRFRPLLMAEQIVAITLVLAALGMAAALAAIWLRTHSPMAAARHFDVAFDLNERISTALELLDGVIHTSSALATAQMEDAWLAARTVRAKERLPLQVERGDLLALLGLGLALSLLLIVPNAQSEALTIESAQSAAEAAAVEHAADAVRELIEQIAADPHLGDAQRGELLQALADSAQVLNDPDVTPEQVAAAMSEVQGAFQQASDSLAQRLSENAVALQAASEALRTIGSPAENGDLTAIERMLDQIEAMRELAEQAGQQPQIDAAQSLSDAAQALQVDGSSPDMQRAANALQQAADAMRQGDQTGAQQSLSAAQAALDQAGSEAAQQQQTQGLMEQAAQAAQQAGSQMNQAQQPQGAQAGQQPQQNQPGGQPQSGEGEQSAQQGQGAQGDAPGQGQEGDARQGANGGDQGQSQQGEGQQSGAAQGDNPGALSGAALRSQGAGAGDNASGEAQPGQSDGAIQANNNPDGVGEGDYTPIYAPSLIGGERGSDQIILESDIEDAPVVEGNLSGNPAGSARVPYSQVFRNFRNAATRDLDAGYAPLSLRDVVRSYFTSIEPGTGR